MNEQTRALKVAEACEPAVNAYLLTRTFAEVKRAEVDAVKLELLTESVYMAPENRRDGRPERITEPRYDWLMSDADFKDYHANVNHIERERGIKPKEMIDDHCPALVAEHLLMKAEWAMLETAWALVVPEGPVDGWENLYGEMRKKFIDLVIKMVVNRPGYKNPLTGKAA